MVIIQHCSFKYLPTSPLRAGVHQNWGRVPSGCHGSGDNCHRLVLWIWWNQSLSIAFFLLPSPQLSPIMFLGFRHVSVRPILHLGGAKTAEFQGAINLEISLCHAPLKYKPEKCQPACQAEGTCYAHWPRFALTWKMSWEAAHLIFWDFHVIFVFW